MNKKYPFLFLFFLLLTLFKSQASSNIGFGAIIVSTNIIKPNDTLIINTFLLNYGPQAFNGDISFNFAINGVQNVDRSIFTNPLQGEVIHIQSGDSFPLQFHVVVQPQYLVPGSDIFVVWPIISNGNFVIDSLTIGLTVKEPDPTGIVEAGGLPKLKVYYSEQSIVIDCSEHPEDMQIRIFDISGRVVYNGPVENNQPIPFYQEDAGVYLVEVSSGVSRKTFKVVKPDK